MRTSYLLLIILMSSTGQNKSSAQKPDLDPDGPVVETSSGKVQGFISKSTKGSTFYGFLAIPYALPPVGPLRFKPPEQFDRWTGILDGSSIGPQCPQIDLKTKKYDGDEDCLYLNVYVHKHANWPQQLLPVMFYIHGGGFSYETGRYDVYGPQNYMDYPVVLVIFNYRLGPLGFLSTNDSNAYGNYGMLDQVLAMKWVQNNIRLFGGDPDMVTIFGNSAGAASVFHHLLSPLSKDLFKKAIVESGTAIINYWTVKSNPLDSARKLANVLECDSGTKEDIVDCLSAKTAEDIILAANQLQMTTFFPVMWAPVVEAPGGPGFLTETPISIIKNGRIANKVPLIIGQTVLEGYTMYWDMAPTFKYNGSEYFEKQFPDQLSLFTPIQPYMTSAIEAIANQYYRTLDLNNETVFINTFSKITGDTGITAGTAEAADLLSEAGMPVHVFIYDYISQDCLAALFNGKCGVYSSHADELYLQFRYFSPTRPLNRDDTEMSNIINSLWVDFASSSTGRSNGRMSTWPVYSKSVPDYLVLNLSPTVTRGPITTVTSFWAETIPSLIQKYKKH